jgi:hypothetical protein
VALPKEHPLAQKTRLSLRDIAGEPFIHYTASDVPRLHAPAMILFESGLGAILASAAVRGASRQIVFRPLTARSSAQVSIGLPLAYNPGYEVAAARRFRAQAQPAGTGPMK